MKRLLSLLAVSTALMLVVLPFANAQGGAPPPGGAPGGAQAEKPGTFEGQLTKVDAAGKTISVKGAAGEMQFRYDDKTQVQGPEKDIQGLAAKTGTPVRVTYRGEKDNAIATSIQVMEKK